MKTAALVVVLVFSSLAAAQDKPAAAPSGPTATPLPATPPPAAAPAKAAAAPAAPAPAAAAAKSVAPKPMTAARKARREEDARHCLEKASNDEIIKCAEEYL